MPFLQIKNFIMISVAINKCFRFLDAVSKVGSNLEIFKDMGKVCSKAVLFLMIGNSRDSVKWGNLTR